ncbi:MAG: hypothetical protein ACYC35_19795 [Pirellulales bacterium]
MRLLRNAPPVLLAMAVGVWAFGWGGTAAYAQCSGCGHTGSHAGHGAVSTPYPYGAASGGIHVGHGTAWTGYPQGAVSGGSHVGHGMVGMVGMGAPGASSDQAGHDHSASDAHPAPPHGGQLKEAKPFTFEVVYLPREIRVYLYGDLPAAQSAKGVTGEVSLQRPNDKRATRLVLRYVAQPAGQQDYLSAAVDLSRVKDRDLVATLKLKNLPLVNHPGINFAQPVIVSNAKPRVSLAALDASDQAGVARQKLCPVSGERLGGMGEPVKVLIDGRPLYLCCKGCLAKVQGDPEAYLRKVAPASQAK